VLWALGASFALALFNVVLVRFIEAVVPPTGRFIEVDGLRVHVHDSGASPGHSGPPLVFVHGLLGQLNEFSFALAGRFPERRVVLIDRPGSGYSQTARPQTLTEQAKIVAGTISALGLDKPVIVGHSLGGAIALALALDFAGMVGGLALIAPLTKLVATPPKPFDDLGRRRRLALWLGAWTLGPIVTLLRAGTTRDVVFAPDPMSPRFWSQAGGLLGARPSALLAAADDIVTQPRELPDMMARYRELECPIGVLFGDGDKVLDPASQGAAFCAATPGAHYERIAGGHMLPLAHPAECEAFIRRVLARLEPCA